jgi:replication initiation protein RepC
MTTRPHLGEQSSYAGSPPAFTVTDCDDDFGTSGRYSAPGERSISLTLLEADRAAIPFDGLPEGVTSHRRLVDTVETALRCMGVSGPAITLALLLAKLTRKQDWQKGGRPIVWPSNLTLQDQLNITGRHVRRLILELREAGALVMADSGNMKRHGRRDAAGTIVQGQAFGFDLSTWATCYATFADIVATFKAECIAREDARRTLKTIKRKIDRMVELAEAEGFDLTSHRKRAQALWEEKDAAEADGSLRATGTGTKAAVLAALAHRMELLRADAVSALAARAEQKGKSCATSGGKEHEMSATADTGVLLKNTTETTSIINLVQARREEVVSCSSTSTHRAIGSGCTKVTRQQDGLCGTAAASVADSGFKETDQWAGRTSWQGGELNSQTVETTPEELAVLVPEIGDRMAATNQPPTWGSFTVATADYAASYGINRAMVHKAERLIGWQSAHIALAVVASKACANFDVSPGAYYNGMLKKAAAGELDLRRSLWGLRQLHAGVPIPSVAVRQTAQAVKMAAKVASKDRDKPAVVAPPHKPQLVRRTDTEEDRAQRQKAASMQRLGNATQSLGTALAGMVAAAPVKRALASVLIEPRSLASPVAVPAAQVAAPDPVTAKIMADLAASRAQATEAEATKLAAMTPPQRALYEEKERIRRQVCAQYRRKDGQRF